MQKTLRVGRDPRVRVCQKLETSLCPTIVSADKKGYEIKNTLYNRHKNKYYKAANQKDFTERNYIQETLKQLNKVNKRSEQIFSRVPKHLSNKPLQDQFIKSMSTIYKRNMYASIHTKKVLEWTQDKMLEQAKEIEEKKRKDYEQMLIL